MDAGSGCIQADLWATWVGSKTIRDRLTLFCMHFSCEPRESLSLNGFVMTSLSH